MDGGKIENDNAPGYINLYSGSVFISNPRGSEREKEKKINNFETPERK